MATSSKDTTDTSGSRKTEDDDPPEAEERVETPHLVKEEVHQCPRCGNIYYDGGKCEMCGYRKGDPGFE